MNNRKVDFLAVIGFYGYYQLAMGVIVGIFCGELIYSVLTDKTHPFGEMWFIGILALLISFIFFDVLYTSKVVLEIVDGNMRLFTSQYNFLSRDIRYDQYIIYDPKKIKSKPMLLLEVRFDKNLIVFSEVLSEDRISLPHYPKTNMYIKYRKLRTGTIDQIVALIDEYNSGKASADEEGISI